MSRLYTTPKSANGVKALAVRAHLEIDCEVELIDVYAGAGRSPDYLRINPLGKVPALIDGELTLTESNAILQYLAEVHGHDRMGPTDPASRADVARWLFWEASHWQPVLSSVLTPHVAHRLGLATAPTHAAAWDDAELVRMTGHLARHLQHHDYLCSDTLTVADLSVAAMLIYVDGSGFPLEDHPSVRDWYGRVSALPAWSAALVGSPWVPAL